MPQLFKLIISALLLMGARLQAPDVGPARYAREIEGMLIFWRNARLNGRGFDYHLRPTPGRL